jgi:hypothetical protein
MNILRSTILALMITCAGAASAQQAPATPRPEAKQFDFLIGHWELEVHPKADSLMAKIHGAPQLREYGRRGARSTASVSTTRFASSTSPAIRLA